MPAAPSSARTVLSEDEEIGEIAKVFCKRCGAPSKPFSKYCETCGNTLDLSKEALPSEDLAKAESPENDLAENETEKPAITGKLAVPPAAAAFRTQADSPTGRLQASLSDRGARPASFETLAEIDPGGRKTTAFNDSYTTNFAETTEPLVGRPTDPNPNSETVITSLPSVPPIKSEQEIQRSDARGANMVWFIILFLTLCAGFVALQIYRTAKSRSVPGSASQNQTADQSAPIPQAASPDVASSPLAPAADRPEGKPLGARPIGMVYVPGGTFKMGRDDGDEFESPAHEVTIKPFYIDRTELSNEEYQQFILATDRRAPTHWVRGQIPEGQAKFPVVNVSWADADAYARWANKRLPTEAEWEFAARGTDGRVYPWGNDWKRDYANAGQGKNGAPVATGQFGFGVSPFGALDMCGNVWEWTASDFEDYPGKKGASVLAEAKLKVIRGGAFNVEPKRATTTYRGAIPPDRVPDKTGFRCVRDVQ
jgi:formylglycine-generating enzyme required for sulfatase activity